MKNILIPTDFSANADNALDFAIEMANKMNAKITLLHVYDIPVSPGTLNYEVIAEEKEIARQDSEKNLRKRAAKVKSAGLACKTISEYELAEEKILKAGKEIKADLIVMGTKGAHNAVEALMGTTTAAIIDKSDIPVFAIPENCHFYGIRNIVFATNYNSKDLDLFEKTFGLFKPFNAHVALVHVAENSEKESQATMLAFVEKLIEKSGLSDIPHTVLPPGNTEEELEMFIRERSVDLLVVAPGHHRVLGRLFGKSLSHKMAFHTHTPLLAIH